MRSVIGLLIPLLLSASHALGADPVSENSVAGIRPEKPADNQSVVTRSYPICYFNKRPSAVELEQLERKLFEFIKPYMPRGILETGMSPTSRWVSVKGMQSGHRALKKVWPQIGCYGHYLTSAEYTQQRRCAVYLEHALKDSSYMFAGESSDGDGISGQLLCDGK